VFDGDKAGFNPKPYTALKIEKDVKALFYTICEAGLFIPAGKSRSIR
jgi:hypothetical protein